MTVHELLTSLVDERKDPSLTSDCVENLVHASSSLSMNGCEVSKIKYFTVRPEPGRRAPIEFSHSLTFRMTVSLLSC